MILSFYYHCISHLFKIFIISWSSCKVDFFTSVVSFQTKSQSQQPHSALNLSPVSSEPGILYGVADALELWDSKSWKHENGGMVQAVVFHSLGLLQHHGNRRIIGDINTVISLPLPVRCMLVSNVLDGWAINLQVESGTRKHWWRHRPTLLKFNGFAWDFAQERQTTLRHWSAKPEKPNIKIVWSRSRPVRISLSQVRGCPPWRASASMHRTRACAASAWKNMPTNRVFNGKVHTFRIETSHIGLEALQFAKTHDIFPVLALTLQTVEPNLEIWDDWSCNTHCFTSLPRYPRVLAKLRHWKKCTTGILA